MSPSISFVASSFTPEYEFQYDTIMLARGPGFVVDGYIYTKNAAVQDIKYLACHQKSKCKGRAVIRGNNAKITMGHNHPKPNLTLFEFKAMLRTASRKAESAGMSSLEVYEMVKLEMLAKYSLASEKMEVFSKIPSYYNVLGLINRCRAERRSQQKIKTSVTWSV